MFGRLSISILWVILILSGCESTPEILQESPTATDFKTKNLIIVVIDGPRYEDTWGDPQKAHIPYFANELAQQGVHYSNFYNRGATYTTSGHTALTTGDYQWMSNDGSEIPRSPSIFQLWLQQTLNNPRKAQIITSKEKLKVLADCTDPQWRGRFNPLTETENRDDQATFQKALEIFEKDQPNLVLIHFRGPDHFGHANDWDNYLRSIQETDELTFKLWEYLQNHPNYQDVTTLLVTNDHGRHKDTVRDGFISHGDFCEGCMHINLYATGPDFHANRIINQHRQSVDLTATVSALMDIKQSQGSGQVMWELFK